MSGEHKLETSVFHFFSFCYSKNIVGYEECLINHNIPVHESLLFNEACKIDFTESVVDAHKYVPSVETSFTVTVFPAK